ncbi:microfibril associated protein 5 [Astyanax mexicanus]|uniref:microfibril associated protein 5 n=1 Tax=Astyanax mexicanus TaxID=7994 RepID=UPI000BBD5AE8|nr:microfibril associated protein 5 [Astyanax mexicanus]
MGSYPTAVLLCCFYGLVMVLAQQPGTEPTYLENGEEASDCREEMYPCTRMYSVHRPVKRCIHSLCLYSLPRVYVINKEICVRTVCLQDEILKAELCREKSGWPKRIQRSARKRCLRRINRTWASKN